MLGIQVNGEFLDLPPDSKLELEVQNPFLQFTEELKGGYSLPASALNTEKNLRLLNYAGVPQTKITAAAVDALIYDNSLQVAAAKMKVEKVAGNLNNIKKGSVNFYLLTEASGFYQEIKDKKMRAIDMGGARTFDGGPIPEASPFFLHVNTVMQAAPGSYDYAFYPVVNSSWGTDPGPEYALMNSCSAWGGGVAANVGPIVPFPYLKYTLEKLAAYIGYTIEGDVLDDSSFEKITLINFRSINWADAKQVAATLVYEMPDEVSFDLKDHLPDITIAEFLLALKNRFGWWYEFDLRAKKIIIKSISSVTGSARKDMTGKSSPLISKNIKQEKQEFALRNNFITGGGEGVKISTVDYQGEADSVADLPPATDDRYAYVYLITEENNYYVCVQDETEAWNWEILAANIYDYEPDNSSDEIVTMATTVEMVKYFDFLDLIPRIDGTGTWSGIEGEAAWGIHLCFFYGMRDNKNGDPYPFASHHIYDSTGAQVGNWSLAFKGKKTDGTEVGLYDLNWKTFLDMLNSPEEVEHTLSLPLHEYLQLKFSDRVVVAGIELFIKQIKSSIPYAGQVNCVSVRI